MKRLKLVEANSGDFGIKDFGSSIAGTDGNEPFDLEIVSADGWINVLVHEVRAKELFTKLDVKGEHFSKSVYFDTKFIEVSRGKDLIRFETTKRVVELFKRFHEQKKVKNNSKTKIVFLGARGAVFILPVTGLGSSNAAA